MGSVWEALNERTSKRVALKLILKPSDDLRRRLLREAHACGSLSHRNIVELYDVGETETGDPFLVMQLLHGETLMASLEHHRRLSPQTAAHVARDIALALAAAHASRVIHRDLKPANVFLHRIGDEDGFTVKVLDFGVSRMLDAKDTVKTRPGTVVGSPAYMSPEQFMMAEDLDHRTDIWSLGVCLFEMIVGVRPFLGTYQEIMEQVLTTNAPSISSRVRFVDDGLAMVVARCLKRERAMRIGSAAELAAMLERYANARPEAPVVIASPGKELTPNGTMIIAPEGPPKKVNGAEPRDVPGEGAMRPRMPWREASLSDILTATSASVSTIGASTNAGVTTSVAPPMEAPTSPTLPSPPVSEPRRTSPERVRPTQGPWWMIAGFLGLGIVCLASFLAVIRGTASARPIAMEKGLWAASRVSVPVPPLPANEVKSTIDEGKPRESAQAPDRSAPPAPLPRFDKSKTTKAPVQRSASLPKPTRSRTPPPIF